MLEVAGSGRFSIEQIATVGRAADSQILLNLRSVSRHHARIFYEAGHYWIKDLESVNGTSVNGKQVNLQMLSDNDRICFGEVKATFHDSGAPPGPVALAQDPLADSDADLRDGTPTGGLEGKFEQADASVDRDLEFEVERLRREVATKHEEVGILRQRIETLQAENAALREDDYRKLGSVAGALQSSPNPEKLLEENERLRRLINQLERALSDSNQRTRNLQGRLEGLSEPARHNPNADEP